MRVFAAILLIVAVLVGAAFWAESSETSTQKTRLQMAVDGTAIYLVGTPVDQRQQRLHEVFAAAAFNDQKATGDSVVEIKVNEPKMLSLVARKRFPTRIFWIFGRTTSIVEAEGAARL